MKISIRASIMNLFFSLMLLVGAAIIGINYHALEKTLHVSAQNLLVSAGHRVRDNVVHHLQYVTLQAKIAEDLIARKNVTPGPTRQFANFLFSYLINNPELFAAYWGSAGQLLWYRERRKKWIRVRNYFTPATGRQSAILHNGRARKSHWAD